MPMLPERTDPMSLQSLQCAALGVLVSTVSPVPAVAQDDIAPAEARAIARDAYVYSFPMVDSYRILHAYFVDRDNPEYKGPFNQIRSFARVFTPQDKAVQTPNSDTPCSFLGLDLRAEPMVLSVSPIARDRYFSVQLIDLYTFNFDYIGSRATGSEGGAFLIAGPRWDGSVPDGITKVIRSETELAIGAYRTQLFGPDDIDNVKKIQAGCGVQPLSSFLGQAASRAAPEIDFITPLAVAEEKSSLDVFRILNFLLQFCPTHPRSRSSWHASPESVSAPGRPSTAGRFLQV